MNIVKLKTNKKMRVCNCNSSFANTGSVGCKQLFAVARKLILVPTFDSTGVRNKIAAADVLTAPSYFTNLINQTDPTKRWYPTGLIDNIEDLRAEPDYETLNSGKKIFIQDGVRTFKGIIIEESNIYIDKLLGFQCKDFSAYIIDKDRNLIGSYDGTDLYPIQIENETFTATLVKTADKTVQKIAIAFEFSAEERDEDLRMVTESEMTGTNALNLEGLLDVNPAISGILGTGFTNIMTTDYGTFKTPVKVVGWVKADFVLTKVGGAVVTITSVTENPTGTYTFVVPTCTGAHALTASKTGYEFPSTTVTFP